MILLCSLLIGLLVAIVYFAAHQIGYNRGLAEGRRQIAEDRYELEMASFWARQEWFRQQGFPYMNSSMEVIYPDG